MKIKEIINKMNEYQNIINEEVEDLNYKKTEFKNNRIKEDNVLKIKTQNDTLNALYDEFNSNKNSFIYKFVNTDSPKIKKIEFKKAMFIDKITLDVKNFIYNKTINFKLNFYTIDNSVISIYALPYEYKGDYIEEVKFFNGQTKSLFKTINTEKVMFYDIIKGSDDKTILKKTNVSYMENIDEEGFVIYNTNHSKDRIVAKYTPISSEFTREIGDKITSVTLELSDVITSEIVLNIINK